MAKDESGHGSELMSNRKAKQNYRGGLYKGKDFVGGIFAGSTQGRYGVHAAHPKGGWHAERHPEHPNEYPSHAFKKAGEATHMSKTDKRYELKEPGTYDD